MRIDNIDSPYSHLASGYAPTELTMNVQKLFHVLVLGGAAITACSDDAPSDTGTSGEGTGGNENDGSGAAATTAAAGGDGNVTGGSVGGAGGPSAGAGAAGGVTSAGGGDTPTCSDPPSPTDPCGCPCCWADCPNTDDACCSGFCASGNDDAGCCGL